MNRSDNIRFLQELSYRRRRMAWRAGGMVAAIALSSCIGTGVAFADDVVVDTSDEQVQAVLVQDMQDSSAYQGVNPAANDEASLSDIAEQADAASENVASEPNASELGDEQPEEIETDQSDAGSASDETSSEPSEAMVASNSLTSAASSATTAADDGTLAEDSAVKDANGEIIKAFDLRHAKEDTDGTLTSDWSYSKEDAKSIITGGVSYVTPVKLQNPWGSCWAFASTAASETSLLTELDKADDGELNGSINSAVAAAWAKLDEADDGILNGSIDYGSLPVRMGILAEYASDLSERHLAWFSFYDVSSDSVYPDQVGEGKYLVSGSKDADSIFDAGGWPWLSMTEYANGIGPVPEWMAPYISDETLYVVPTLELNDAKNDFVYITVDSLEKAEEYIKTYWTDTAIQKFNDEHRTHVTAASARIQRSSLGTWGLDDSEAYTVVAELSNSNVLDQNLSTQGLSAQEITLMKQELLEGHAISIVYKADQSRPGQTLAGNTYMNTSTWAQYTYDVVSISHSVTIVGYDDNYAASNFTHNIYMTDAEGNLIPDGMGGYLVDEDKTALTTPAGNGAWIVKNSWGSTDADSPVDKNTWGIDGSGYFYLSYYDKTISHMESYEYDVSEEAQERLGYLAYQHDLANVDDYKAISSSDIAKMCNVFAGPEEGEGSILIRDLGFVTGAAGDTVTVEVYVMENDADVVETIESGKANASTTQSFVNSGFHRIHLDAPIVVLPNEKFAVVQTTKRLDGSYEYIIMDSYNKSFVDAYNAITEPLGVTSLTYYLQTVVNRGESLLMSDGSTWQDWVDVFTAIDKESVAVEMKSVQTDLYEKFLQLFRTESDPDKHFKYLYVLDNCKNFTVESVNAFDNWCIKAYADDGTIEIAIEESDGVEKTPENSKALSDTCESIAKSLNETGDVQNSLNVKEFTEGSVRNSLKGNLKAVAAGMLINRVAEDKVAANDKELIAAAAQSLASGNETSEVLAYFNIDFLLKNAKTGEALAAITQTTSPIFFAVELDDDIMSQLVGKELHLVGAHNGIAVYTEISLQNKALHFWLSHFSTYALVAVSAPAPDPTPEPAPEPNPYSEPDSEASAQAANQPGADNGAQAASYAEAAASPKTGDNSAAAVGFLGALAALCSGVLLRLRRRLG